MRLHGLALGLCLLAQPALAGGSVCVMHGASLVVFSKPKLPKPGASNPLTGRFDIPNTSPLSGTLSRSTTGQLVAGITYYLAGGVTCFARMAIDESLAGTGTTECTNDLSDDIATTWTPVDCPK
jgi:hypothetical protein